MPEDIGYPADDLAAAPLPPQMAAGAAPIAPPVDNAGGALPPELMELLMMILGGQQGAPADPIAANPIMAALMGAGPTQAGRDGMAIGASQDLPPQEDVVQ